MSKTHNNSERRKLVFSAWLHVAREAYFNSRGKALIVLVVSLLNTLSQLLAVSVVVGVAQALSRDGAVSLFGLELQINISEGNAYLAVLAVVASLAAATLFQTLIALLTARYRREFFADSIRLLLSRLKTLSNTGSDTPMQTRLLARLLRRECRYLSRSYVAALSIIPSIMTFIGIAAFAVWNFPNYALWLAVALAATAPVHLGLTIWGANVSDDLVVNAQRKAKADEKILTSITASSPYAQIDDSLIEDHVVQPEVADFLNTYQNRMRFGAYSMLISSLTGTIVLGVVIFLFVRSYLQGSFDAAGAVFVIIAMRLLVTTAGVIATGLSLIGSYQPFVQELLAVLGLKAAAPAPRTVTETTQGSVVLVFDPNPLSIFNAWRVHMDFRPTKKSLKPSLVLHEYPFSNASPRENLGLQRDDDAEDVFEWLPTMTEQNRQALRSFLDRDAVDAAAWAALPAGVKAACAMKYAIENGNASIVVAQAALQSLTLDERNTVLSNARRQLVVIMCQSAPKRALFSADAAMYAAQGSALEYIGDMSQLAQHQTRITELLDRERARMARKESQYQDDDEAVEETV